MARPKTRKLPSRSRETTAAYAASQPLFDALRTSCERLSEQRLQLSIARDLVQRLHVKLPHATTEDDEDDAANHHRRYMSCAVRAYTAAMESYAEIFEGLAAVTAADATEGREQRDGHEVFAAMAKLAAQGKEAGSGFVGLVVEEGRDQSPSTRKRGLSDEASAIENGSEPRANKVQRLSENIKYDDKGHKILWDKGAAAPNVPYGTMGSSEKKAWKHERLQQQREKKRQKKQEQRARGDRVLGELPPVAAKTTPEPTLERDAAPLDTAADFVSFSEPAAQYKEPGVEYEDVSLEVDARLKAKEEKRRAKEKEKKRKRASDQSVAGVEEDKKEKKRSKHEDDTAEGTGISAAVEVNGDGLRKIQGQTAESGRKKQKKQKKKHQ